MIYHDTPQSSNIARIGHDAAAKKMRVEFNNGSVYEYPGVETAQFHAFKNAPSHGAHFAQNFRGWAFKKVQ